MTKVTARAHGRVNLIGEHTDYNGGWVLPTSIPQFTEVEIEEIVGTTIELISNEDRIFHFEIGKEYQSHSWADYLMGALKFLREKSHDKNLSAFRARITSSIPEGSGLSSSAALEMSFLKALKELYSLEISDVELARIGQKAENEFVGAKVGIMDQMATLLARSGEALFLDTKTLNFERINLPMEEMDLLVINSGISHKLSATDGGYNQRRSQCEEACRYLSVPSLREASIHQIENSDMNLTLKRRARHVVTENFRVHAAVEAIRQKDLIRLGKLFVESHESMKNDYEVSIPEIDLLVRLCLEEPAVFGARLTGGGFGGSIVAIARKHSKEEMIDRILVKYKQQTGEEGKLLA